MAEETTESLFRSKKMSYVQVLLPQAVSEEFADAIGREDCLQFTDLNEDFQPFQRAYTGEIIKTQEIERRVRVIEDELKEYGIEFDAEVSPDDLQSSERPSDASQIVDATGKEVNDAFKRLKEQTSAEKQLKAELEAQEDMIDVLSQMDVFLSSRREMVEERLGASDGISDTDSVPLMSLRDGAGNQRSDVGFKYLAGVVTLSQRVSFERQVFLTSRGNSFVQFDESVDSDDGKMAFVVFFLGDNLQRSLRRLCTFMNIQICYESDSERSREELLAEAQSKRSDYHRIHYATKNSLLREMREIGKSIKTWKITLAQEKAIRITLNKFKSSQRSNNVLTAKGWCPTDKKDLIQRILDRIVENKGVGRAVLTDARPIGLTPTHFETNDFTGQFQAIVNTYGVPRYQEFNPAVPTIITFPFLFAVMYGDMFHGSCIFLGASSLFLMGMKTDMTKTGLAGLYSARWMLLLMGSFAIYCGMIYNDAMSIMINGWNGTQWIHANTADGDTVVFQNDVYAVGVDPAWRGVDNQLTFENSLKMKLSVIIGVTQMTFGLFIKLSNHIQERDPLSIYHEFIPQLIFMVSFFGYMIFLIFYKWCINWATSELPDIPSIITILINFVLSPGSIDSSTQIFDNKGFQEALQGVLLLGMFVSIPWMLLAKPLILKSRHERGVGGHVRLDDEDHEDDDDEESDEKRDEDDHAGGGGGHGHGHGHGDEFVFSEIMIHQLIHTIEYVLGTVSNTASYLRLWALSLAHAELSDVFYEKTIQGTLSGTGPMAVVMSVVAVCVFFMITFGVLLVMDVLECFLHALRLHWVEFQNKFFYADGVAFTPFSYRAILKTD